MNRKLFVQKFFYLHNDIFCEGNEGIGIDKTDQKYYCIN